MENKQRKPASPSRSLAVTAGTVALVLVIVVPLCLYAAYTLLGLICSPYTGRGEFQYAEIGFVGRPEELDFLHTGSLYGRRSPVADLYLQDVAGQVYRLQTLDEETVKSWIPPERMRDAVGEHSHSEEIGKCFTYEIDGSTDGYFAFCDGKLVAATMHPSSRFKFGRSADGEFVSLPITREKMESLFGKDYQTRWLREKSLLSW